MAGRSTALRTAAGRDDAQAAVRRITGELAGLAATEADHLLDNARRAADQTNARPPRAGERRTHHRVDSNGYLAPLDVEQLLTNPPLRTQADDKRPLKRLPVLLARVFQPVDEHLATAARLRPVTYTARIARGPRLVVVEVRGGVNVHRSPNRLT